MSPLAGSSSRSSCVSPDVARSFPSGLKASACGRISGKGTWIPAGVKTWFTGTAIPLVAEKFTGSMASITLIRLSVLEQPSRRPRTDANARNDHRHGNFESTGEQARDKADKKLFMV